MTCRWSALALLLLCWLLGCASPGGPTGSNDLSATAIVDLGGGRDGSPAVRDLASGDAPPGPCTLGTPDHCGTCATVCPPGMDDTGTKRTCSAATAFGSCDVICKGEYYDVNGLLSDGCEALDEPIQDTSITAVTIALPGTYTPTADLGVAGGNPHNVIAKVYGDARTHEIDPTMRPLGREDWYKITATGTGDSAAGPTACLGITNFPADNMFEVCISTSATFLASGCKTATGMMGDMASASQCVSLANEVGTFYVRVRKLSGSWTSLSYALFLKH